ncbi:lipopolysaccharide biosynthesis protein [Qipengyuania sp. CAU 1752]
MNRKPLTQEAVGNVGWQALVMGSNLILKAGILILLARSMPAAQFGLVAAATVITSLATDFSQMGVHRALVQRLRLDPAHIRTAFALSLHSGIAAAVLLFLAAPWFADLLRIEGTQSLIRFLALTLFVSGISSVSASLLERERRFRTLGLIDLASYFTGFGLVALPLAMFDYGAWALAIGHLTQALVRCMAMMIVATPKMALIPRWQESKDLLRTGIGFSAGQIGNYLATQADYFVVGRWLGAEALGLYSRAYQFLMLPTHMFGKVTSTVLFPTLASIQDQPERVARAYVRALGIIALMTLPVGGALAVLAPELILVLLGSNWTGMVLPFQILVSMLLFRTSYKISDSVVLAMGSMYQRARLQFLYAGAVAGGSLLGLAYGLPGVAVGVGSAVALNYLMMMTLARRVTGLPLGKVLGVQLKQLPGAVAIVAPLWIAATEARQAAFPDQSVLGLAMLAGLFSTAFAWVVVPGLFGAEGRWLRDLVVDRIETLRSRRGTAPAE